MTSSGQNYRIKMGKEYQVPRKSFLEEKFGQSIPDLQDNDTVKFEKKGDRISLIIVAHADKTLPTSPKTFIPGHVASLTLGQLGLVEAEPPAITGAPAVGEAILAAAGKTEPPPETMANIAKTMAPIKDAEAHERDAANHAEDRKVRDALKDRGVRATLGALFTP